MFDICLDAIDAAGVGDSEEDARQLIGTVMREDGAVDFPTLAEMMKMLKRMSEVGASEYPSDAPADSAEAATFDEDPPAGEGRCWISDRRRSAPAAVRHERSEARTAVDAVRRRSEYPTVARAQGSIRVSVPRVGSGEIPDQRFPMVGRSSSSDHLSANQNLGRSALETLQFLE